MVQTTRVAHTIEITAENFQQDLARLAVQKDALERELAAVVAHLDSVQRALDALTSLMPEAGAADMPSSADTIDATAVVVVRPDAQAAQADSAPAEAAEAPEAVAPVRRKATQSRRQPAKRHGAGTSVVPPPKAGEPRTYGKLTEQILDHFAQVGPVEQRARDVAAALGRDTDSGSINAVRSTLDRLVGASRIGRSGRGLYHVMS